MGTGRFCAAFFLIGILLFVIYSNSFSASWQFDDFVNIVDNPDLKINDFSFNSLKKAAYAAPQATGMNRPAAYLSFAVNWYFGQDNVFGYHVFNLFVHYIASVFIFLSIFYLLCSPLSAKRYSPSEKYFIALLASVLWAANPIQTQAVTYIVQRMAEMAGMFYIIAFYFYVRGRLCAKKIKMASCFAAAILFYLLALASKLNSALLPITLLFTEFIFFQDISNPRSGLKALLLVSVSGLLIASAGYFYFYSNNINLFLEQYRIRPFSLTQRVLTEFRVIFFYLSEIFYPVPTRLSIEHVYPLSTSICSPPTTLLCMLALFFLICCALYMTVRAPVTGFAILFFLTNHLVESSVIALELVFEHRNYIPSMFLFFPVSAGVLSVFKYYRHRNRAMYAILVSAVTFLIFLLGTGTHIRNMAWNTQKSLWDDAMAKAPGSPRPYHNLAWGYYEQKGDYASAFAFYGKAASLQYVNTESLAQPYYCMGNVLDKMKLYEKAIPYYHKSIHITADYVKPHIKLAIDLIRMKKFIDAEKEADYLFSRFPDDASTLWLKGLICLDRMQTGKALYYFRQSLFSDHSGWKIYFYIGTALNLSGEYDRALWFLKRADKKKPEIPVVELSLALNRFLSGDENNAVKYIDKFIDIAGICNLKEFFALLPVESYHVPFGFKRIRPLIQKRMNLKIRRLEDMASGFGIRRSSALP